MGRNATDTRPFAFRQFQLFHHQSTMKVGIDATILGIWAQIHDKEHVLDVGCGSGVVSLLIASRVQCFVTAIDIDKPSVAECALNFHSSPFADRLSAQHISLQQFSKQTSQNYDHVVSNPPFFTLGSASANIRLGHARHTLSLTYVDLITSSFSVLKPDGKLTVVLPYSSKNFFVEQSRLAGFFPSSELLIFPRRGMPPNRVYLSFSKSLDTSRTEMLSLREDDGRFSSEYLDLVENYYL